ncbi:MAG: sigma 54-interacting transcriptional regulator [Desulfocapsaceae bacterium]|nr:sigma 54-interacting transcriptional regulator [Desulfocapsaceae bacterium]
MTAKILIIDDEESIRFTFERFLRAAGYTVVTAESCAEAIEQFAHSSFDMVFADIILGDGTGIDILREIKSRGLICPVIMVTGDPGLETATESIRLGAFDYIPKPINQESLLHAARTALKYKAINEENEKFRANLEAIFRSVKDAIITVNADGVVIEINEAAVSIFGYSPNDKGKAFNTLQGTGTEQLAKILDEALGTGEPLTVDRIECQSADGTTRVVSVKTFPLLTPQGIPSGLVMVLRDDTRVVDLEKALNNQRQFHRIVGKSGPMQKIFTLISALSQVQTTVLITGESGTGKELVADALYQSGERSSKPMIKINCSALPESLLESELFGHVKGAFTGAIKDNIGRFHSANGGSIFFDEIGEITPTVQVKLLRVLEEREFERLGSSTPTKVDIRLIAATNKDLKEKVSLGEFREDLYYRLKVVEIKLPALRDRREDIPLLVNHFRNSFNATFKKDIKEVSSDVLKAFLKYPWPGNVRELHHTMEHAFVLCNHNIITFDHLPPDFMGGRAGQSPEDRYEADSQAIRAALTKTAWNKAKAARLLGIDRVTLYRKIKRFNIMQSSALVYDGR